MRRYIKFWFKDGRASTEESEGAVKLWAVMPHKDLLVRSLNDGDPTGGVRFTDAHPDYPSGG